MSRIMQKVAYGTTYMLKHKHKEFQDKFVEDYVVMDGINAKIKQELVGEWYLDNRFK